MRIETHYIPDLTEISSPEELDKRPWLQSGTAFYYEVDDRLFLVTARHLVTNRDQRNGNFPGRHSLTPTHLRIVFRQSPSGGPWVLGKPTAMTYVLLPLTDEEGRPRWHESPTHGAGMDTVVMPLDGEMRERFALNDAYTLEEGRELFGRQLWVGQDVFVVGYPDALESGFMMPLWVRGSIATEPFLYFPYRGEQLPIVLIDARTRGGQSGSPVILFQRPNTPIVTPQGQLEYRTAPTSRIVGVYSGRTSHESDLGFVWRIEEVDKMCKAVPVPPPPP